jgi:hypothetical protein
MISCLVLHFLLHPSYPFRDLQWGHSLEGKQTTLLLQEPQTAAWIIAPVDACWIDL